MKVFVCKYEGTPGVDERLQTGQNPISIDWQPGRNPGQYFNDAQGRSYVLAFDVGQDEPGVEECPPPDTGTTTTTTEVPTSTTSTTLAPTTTTTVVSTSTTTAVPTSTTTSPPTSTSTSTTSTTLPTVSLFAIEVAPICPDGTLPEIEITFGVRPDLNGQTGTLSFSTGGSIPLVFNSGGTTDIAYPASAGTGPVTMTYTLGAESVTRTTTFPEACEPGTTTTSSSVAPTTTSSSLPSTTTSSTVIPSTTTPASSTLPPTSSTTTAPSSTSTSPTTSTSTSTTSTLPDTFTFGAAGTACFGEVPTIVITFQSPGFPSLAGETGTLTMTDINGTVVGTEQLVYEPGATVTVLYPGTHINPDGSVADVPGWILNDDGFWIRDPSDEFLREGIYLTYELNPTAGPVLITYPPESESCANPDGPFPPGPTTTTVVLPPTR